MTKYFSILPPEELRKVSIKGGQGNRSEALKKAWKNKSRIIRLYETKSLRQIAKEYGVTHTAIERIVKSDA